eukprot:1410-Amphidinium_carterae.1
MSSCSSTKGAPFKAYGFSNIASRAKLLGAQKSTHVAAISVFILSLTATCGTDQGRADIDGLSELPKA